MSVLFIIALLLAWPTFGLSIVVWFAILLFRTKDRAHYGRVQQAKRTFSSGTNRMPSWANDSDKTQDFFYVVKNVAIKKGISEEFASKAVGGITGASVTLLYIAGAMEGDGASFNSQKMGAVELLVTMWENSSETEREIILKNLNDV